MDILFFCCKNYRFGIILYYYKFGGAYEKDNSRNTNRRYVF